MFSELLSVGQPSRLAKIIANRPVQPVGPGGGVIMHIVPTGGILMFHFMPNIQDFEQKALRRGDLKFSIGESLGCLFYTLETEAGSYDMTWESRLLPLDLRPRYDLDAMKANPDLRVTVDYTLWDLNGYITKAIRIFTLSPRMTQIHARLINERYEGSVMSQLENLQRTSRIYQQYPTVKKLAGIALAYTRWSKSGESDDSMELKWRDEP